jgi:uncharacterized membrane protein
MRTLKGKVKETRREKRERKQDNLANKQNIIKVVIPVLTIIVGLIVAFLYLNTRPKSLDSK